MCLRSTYVHYHHEQANKMVHDQQSYPKPTKIIKCPEALGKSRHQSSRHAQTLAIKAELNSDI